MGHHNIKFGADVRYARQHAVGLDNNNFRSGNFHFAAPRPGCVRARINRRVSASRPSCSATSRSSSAHKPPNTNAQEHQKRFFYYAQDQWRVTNTLTLSYGLRWEWYFPEAVNGKGNGGLLDLNTGNVRIAGYGP